MEHLNQTVNGKALNVAINLMLGPEVTVIVGKLYVAIESAMKDGYELGVIDGQKNVAQATADAFDEGWDYGYDAGETDGLEETDNSYIQGVADARARPETADANVAGIISYMTQDALNGEYDAVEQDIGDEQPERPADEDGYTIGG
ncbi:MAG: hypothetical protein ACHP7H_00470 [Hyphomicrobiales bacterium]